jgi:hypothetical protein
MLPTRLGMTLACLLLTSACTQVYNARVVRLDARRMGEFSVVEPIAVTNAQPSTERTLLGGQGSTTWYGNLNAWTETAVTEMRNELTKRGMPAADTAAKEVRLSVTQARVIFGFAVMRSIINLHVETAGGYVHDFEGNAGSGWTMFRAIDASVARAVQQALNEPAMIRYLSRSAGTPAPPAPEGTEAAPEPTP